MFGIFYSWTQGLINENAELRLAAGNYSSFLVFFNTLTRRAEDKHKRLGKIDFCGGMRRLKASVG